MDLYFLFSFLDTSEPCLEVIHRAGNSKDQHWWGFQMWKENVLKTEFLFQNKAQPSVEDIHLHITTQNRYSRTLRMQFQFPWGRSSLCLGRRPSDEQVFHVGPFVVDSWARILHPHGGDCIYVHWVHSYMYTFATLQSWCIFLGASETVLKHSMTMFLLWRQEFLLCGLSDLKFENDRFMTVTAKNPTKASSIALRNTLCASRKSYKWTQNFMSANDTKAASLFLYFFAKYCVEKEHQRPVRNKRIKRQREQCFWRALSSFVQGVKAEQSYFSLNRTM